MTTPRQKVKLSKTLLNVIRKEKEDFKYFFNKEREREALLINQIKETGMVRVAY